MTNQLTNLQAINDQDLLTATGGDLGATLSWNFVNMLTGGIPMLIDEIAYGGEISKSVTKS